MQQHVLLTGSIGAGKSTVADCFQQLGFTCVSTDQLAKQMLLNEPDIQAFAMYLFGSQIMQEGAVDLVYFAESFFKDADKRSLYETRVHPLVEQRVMALKPMHHHFLVEIPLLWESRQRNPIGYRGFDLTITIEANDAIRQARIHHRDVSRSVAQIRAIMAAQADRSDRSAISDFCIENDQSMDHLKQQLHQALLTLEPLKR